MGESLVTRERKFGNFRLRELGVLIALVAITLMFTFVTKNFFGVENFLNILRQVSLLGVMAVGMTLVIVSGEFDLSVGAVSGLAACIAGVLMINGMSVWLAFIVGLAAGTLFGVLNGVLVTYGKIPALIVTLGTLNVARGLALITVRGFPISISERYVKDPQLANFIFMGQGQLFGKIPMLITFLVVAFIIGYIILNKNVFGYHIRAVGGNASAARASGIDVYKIKIIAFAGCGFLAGLAGILNLSFLSNIQGTAGTGLELNVIAAVIIGGTSLSGGSGTMIGTLIGVLIMGVLKNGLVLLQVNTFWQTLIIGVVIIGAVAVDIWTRRRST